ncbi:YkvA family protein [Qipengyuania marisflavi]|nr:DUF1232 domain-containing protein [Qipengyuania marisflavi]
MLDKLKLWALALKRDAIALYIAARDRRTPMAARLLAAATAAYALSPIDLIPDFIPVLGLLDDLIIVPLGIWLVIKLIPAELMASYREQAARFADRPTSTAGAVFVIALWLLSAAILGLVFLR